MCTVVLVSRLTVVLHFDYKFGKKNYNNKYLS